MGGLLSLACLVICPGVKVCTHRGCPPLLPPRPGGCLLLTGREQRPQWVRVSPRGGGHQSPGTPPSPPHFCLPNPRHTASSVTVRYACAGAARVMLVWCKWAEVCPALRDGPREQSSPRAHAHHIPSLLQLLRNPESSLLLLRRVCIVQLIMQRQGV